MTREEAIERLEEIDAASPEVWRRIPGDTVAGRHARLLRGAPEAAVPRELRVLGKVARRIHPSGRDGLLWQLLALDLCELVPD